MSSSKPQTSSDLFFRRADIARAAEGPLRATLATETPVLAYDPQRRELVDEVLLMRGAQWPERIRMVDGHDPVSFEEGPTVGSVRDLARGNAELQGTLQFSSIKSGQELETLVREGHVEDVSVGGKKLSTVYIARGDSREIDGRVFRAQPTRAMRVVTKWQARHLAVLRNTDGADPNAKIHLAMRAYLDPEGVMRQMAAEDPTQPIEGAAIVTDPVDPAQPIARAEVDTAAEVERLVEAALARRVQADTERLSRTKQEFLNIAQELGVDNADADATRFAREGVSHAVVARHFHDQKMKGRPPVSIYGVESGEDKYRSAVSDGMLLRAHHAFNQPLPSDFKPAAGSEEFRRKPLRQLATDLLIRSGEWKHQMSDRDVMRASFDLARSSDGPAYHSTGNFANLLLDSFSKVLRPTWENTPSTYQRWVRQAESLPDFKTRNVIRLSEVGNLPMVPEGGDYKDLGLSDQKESYRAYKYGGIVSLTWESWVNDDLSGFSRLVALQAASCRRSINASVYNILFSNPTLSDTGALFNNTVVTTAGGHANSVAAALSVTELNTAYTTFATRKGINSDVILGLAPRFLIIPAAYFADAWEILNSTARPTAGGSAVGSAGVANAYGSGGPRNLELIQEPLIDGNDSSSWYLAADPMVIDTIEVAFLQGEETPVFEQETGFLNDTIKYKVRQSWAAAPIEWRGLYRSTT